MVVTKSRKSKSLKSKKFRNKKTKKVGKMRGGSNRNGDFGFEPGIQFNNPDAFIPKPKGPGILGILNPSSQTNPKLGGLGLSNRFGLSGINPGKVNSNAGINYNPLTNKFGTNARTARTNGRRGKFFTGDTGSFRNNSKDRDRDRARAKLGSSKARARLGS
jgi:hypothetical protein